MTGTHDEFNEINSDHSPKETIVMCVIYII